MSTKPLILSTSGISRLGDRQLDYILLDGSGSMHDKWWDMLAAIDAYTDTLKANQVKSRLILRIFDSYDLDLNARDCNIEDHKNFLDDPVGAHWGMTPLFDAIMIMGKNIRDLNPQHGAAITIVTDGNDSPGSNLLGTDIVRARAILDWLRARGFQVTFIGCDFDNSRQAHALGINDSNAIGVQKLLLKDAAKAYGEKRTRHSRTGEDINFSAEERTKFGGLLAAPEK